MNKIKRARLKAYKITYEAGKMMSDIQLEEFVLLLFLENKELQKTTGVFDTQKP